MRFHDRLSIVTKTLEKGAVEIAHFAIMLIIVLGMFTLIAHSSLGTTVEDFHTVSSSFTTMLLVTVGDMGTLGTVSAAAPFVGPLIIWYEFRRSLWRLQIEQNVYILLESRTHIVVVYILLLNILLSILIDAFLEVMVICLLFPSLWQPENVFGAHVVGHRCEILVWIRSRCGRQWQHTSPFHGIKGCEYYGLAGKHR